MSLILSLIILFISIIIHEISHGWVAYKFGDSTAKKRGRLTLNPFRHIDIFGTIILPLLLIRIGSSFLVGYAKPVPIDFRNLKDPKRNMIWIGLAGPAANIIFALILSIIIKIENLPLNSYSILSFGIWINLLLAVFNLLPIPPLDGSTVLLGILPRRILAFYARFSRLGFIIGAAAILLLVISGKFSEIIIPFIETIANMLGAKRL